MRSTIFRIPAVIFHGSVVSIPREKNWCQKKKIDMIGAAFAHSVVDSLAGLKRGPSTDLETKKQRVSAGSEDGGWQKWHQVRFLGHIDYLEKIMMNDKWSFRQDI